ncbi:hypothetical protein C8F01DRAFT_1094027 [Mycena amicta]|nr:hypothetical protein C8F01DRAFT_1094027 [Mycena amicta]
MPTIQSSQTVEKDPLDLGISAKHVRWPASQCEIVRIAESRVWLLRMDCGDLDEGPDVKNTFFECRKDGPNWELNPGPPRKSHHQADAEEEELDVALTLTAQRITTHDVPHSAKIPSCPQTLERFGSKPERSCRNNAPTSGTRVLAAVASEGCNRAETNVNVSGSGIVSLKLVVRAMVDVVAGELPVQPSMEGICPSARRRDRNTTAYGERELRCQIWKANIAAESLLLVRVIQSPGSVLPVDTGQQLEACAVSERVRVERGSKEDSPQEVNIAL